MLCALLALSVRVINSYSILTLISVSLSLFLVRLAPIHIKYFVIISDKLLHVHPLTVVLSDNGISAMLTSFSGKVRA